MSGGFLQPGIWKDVQEPRVNLPSFDFLRTEALTSRCCPCCVFCDYSVLQRCLHPLVDVVANARMVLVRADLVESIQNWMLSGLGNTRQAGKLTQKSSDG